MDNSLPSKKIEKRAKGFLLIILFANFIRYVEISIIDIGLPSFVIQLAGTLSAYGIVVGVFNLSQSIFQFPISILSDKKMGRKNMIVISIIIYSIGTFLCYTAQDIIQLILFRAMQGIGAYSAIIQAMIADNYRKEKEYGKGMALYSFSITIGFVGGFIIGGYISYYFGARSIFLIAGILSIISLVIIFILLKDPQKSFSKRFDNNFDELGKNIKLSDIKIVLKENQFRFIILINMFRWFLFFGVYPYIIWVIQVYYELNQVQSTYVLILIVFLYATFIVVGGLLADRIGHKKTMILGQLIIISFGFLFFLASGLIIFLIVSISVSVGFAMLETAGNAYLSRVLEETHPDLKGTGFGFNNALGFFFSAIGPIFICSLGEIQVFLPFYVVSIIIIVAFLVTIKFIKN
jgi:MFS family permease